MITEREAVLPPAAYLEPCAISLGDGSVQGALQGLRSTIECDRADKAALRAWAAEAQQEGGEPRTEKKVLP
ncbi:hypothetical protein F0A17_01860 [Billgrantia pellis]|uniref:Uncharacterized protein n=1 Tax=Billgrantia pellis TaxID=2606936 RepID=A0A7V7KJ34_9GAMM|nr:hypothetical protein [Halomonas pellis]KAA0014419.1 hypothetical protein F0A17_01860 [Halomonas pellis]